MVKFIDKENRLKEAEEEWRVDIVIWREDVDYKIFLMCSGADR